MIMIRALKCELIVTISGWILQEKLLYCIFKAKI